MLINKIFLLAIACAFVLADSPALYGQATGIISGNVLDQSGASIAGAAITATSQGTGVTRDAQSDGAGQYLIPLLPIGIYTLHAAFAGFQSGDAKDVRLQADEARELDFTLAPASVVSQVEVSASVVAVEASTPSLGQVITA